MSSAASSAVAAPAVAGFALGRASADVPATRGLAKSGRSWKVQQTQRFSASRRPCERDPAAPAAVPGRAFALRMKTKAAGAATKAVVARMRAERKAETDAARRKREDKRKRRAENELRSASFQVLDGNKLKKMNKKQLRQVKRTRLNADGVVELAPAYS